MQLNKKAIIQNNYHFFSCRSAEKIANIASDDINLLGEVGWDFTDATVIAQLVGRGDVTVNINSRGGDYYQGLAIYNALKAHPGKVTTRALGIAASAAAIIFFAGDVREVAMHAGVMIHNASVTVSGNRLYLAKLIEEMTNIDTTIASLISESTGLTLEKVSEMMDKETTVNSQEAVALGFATGVIAYSTAPTNLSGCDLAFLFNEINEINNII